MNLLPGIVLQSILISLQNLLEIDNGDHQIVRKCWNQLKDSNPSDETKAHIIISQIQYLIGFPLRLLKEI